MARIKKYSPEQNLSSFQTLIVDENPNSDYFRITEFKDTFTGGKNGFLIEGSEYLKESTEIKIEILDVNGEPIYYEPGNGIPEYYEGISKLIAVYIYEDTPIGLGKITILGELKEYDDNGVKRQIPSDWRGAYNVKWERTFQINKNLSNEDRVRFYRRPKVGIDEIVKPIFNKTPQTITQTGQVDGLPLIPTENTQLSNFSLPTSYRLKVTDDTYWTGSALGQQIEFSGLNYSPTITDIVNKDEVLVSPPYSESDLVKPFSSQNYSVSFPYVEGAVDLATALTGSFAKINITNMKTFVGDAARVKVFRKSVSQLTDYEFVQEIQLESNELLRDLESVESTETFYGNLSQNYINNYWLTSSNDLVTTFNQDFLYNSVELDNGVSTPQYFYTSQSLGITNGVEYNLSFNVRKRTNISADDYLKVYLSGSFGNTTVAQTITNIGSSNELLQKTLVNENIIADNISGSQLYFEVKGNDWLINNISLRAAEETSFSPDEITFIQSVPKTLAEETFDFRFEFYDINNNYIPVLVEETKTFTGGNLNLFTKELILTPNQLYFAFDSASAPANPLPPLNIFIDVEKRVITGSVTFTSGAYDEFGNLLSSSQYNGGVFPGLLTDRDKDIVKLNVSDYTGSRDDITVQYIEYTGEVEGVTDSFVITRVQDGKGGVNFEIRPYRGTIIKNKDDKELEIQAIRIDGINEIILKDNLPQTGFSDAKLRVLSSSIDEVTLEESGSYILLSEASSTKFIKGLNAGLTGSGEIDYNARFNRDSIDNELTVFLMDGETSQSILTSIILTDLQDGLDSGFVTFDADVFTINPRTQTQFTPQFSSVTGSFYKRGTKANPVSASIEIFPSMSINKDFVPEYWMYFVSNSKDESIEVTAYDENGFYSPHGELGSYIGLPASQSKQLLVNFTYTEPVTSASVQVDHIFTIVPEGKPGDETVLFEVNPQTVNLKSDSRGNINDFKQSITDISLRQGSRRLIFTGSAEPGTFTIASESISSQNIEVGLLHLTSSFGTDYTASLIVSESSNLTQLSGSITYPLEIRPYFTSSVYTQSFTQNFTKILDGPPPIELNIVPQSVTLIANEVEFVGDYSNATTTITVKEGSDNLINTSSGAPGTFTLESINTTNITSNLVSLEGEISASVEFSEFEYPYVSASVTYNINVFPFSLGPGHEYSSSVFERTQNFVKSITPPNARSVELTATSEVVHFDGDGQVTSPLGAITLTAEAYNTTGSVYYGFFRDSYVWQPYSQTNTVTVGSGDATEAGETVSWEVRIRDGGSTANVVATDAITITGVQDGASNYNVQLDNPSVTLTSDVDGTTHFTGSGAVIRAVKGVTPLTHVTTYSPFDGVYDEQGVFIGNLGQYSASIESKSPYLNQTGIFAGNPATLPEIPNGGWTSPFDNPTGTIVYKVDIENGRATYFLSQSFAVTFEGQTGPGVVVRGEWNANVPYLFTGTRRDAVVIEDAGNTHYFATTEALINKPAYTDGSAPYTAQPTLPPGPPYEEGYEDATTGWEYLGQEDFFVAAKIAIFEESFVENTINVGKPSTDYSVNPQIAIYGGDSEPYIAIGQGTQGYGQQGIFLGVTEDGGPNGTQGTSGLFSIENDTGDRYLRWDGYDLEIAGSIQIKGGSAATTSSVDAINNATGGFINPSEYQFGPGSSPDFFELGELPATPSVAGLYLGSDNLGYHDGTDWNAFLDNSGNFYLGGEDGGSLSFQQSSGNLKVSGIISASAGIFGGLVIDDTGVFFPSTYDVGNQYFGESVVTHSLAYNTITYGLMQNNNPGATTYDIIDRGTAVTDAGENAWKVLTRASDPFNSGSADLTAFGLITTNHSITGSASGSGTGYPSNTSAGAFFKVVPSLYALNSSYEIQYWWTGSFSLDAGGANTSNLIWQAGGPEIITSDTSWESAIGSPYVPDEWFHGSGDDGADPRMSAYIHAYDVPVLGQGNVLNMYIPIVQYQNDTTLLSTENNNYGSDIELHNAGSVTLYLVDRRYGGAGGEGIGTLSAGSLIAGRVEPRSINGEALRISTSGSLDGQTLPFLSMGQITASYDAQGLFFGFPSGSTVPRISMRGPDGSFFRYDGSVVQMSSDIIGGAIEGSDIVGGTISVPATGVSASFSVNAQGALSASDANIQGIINANSGRIGSWVIDEDTQALRDDNSEIVFEPNIPEIQLFDSTAAKKVIISPSDALTGTGGTTTTVEWITAQPDPSDVRYAGTGNSTAILSKASSATQTFPQYGSYISGGLSDSDGEGTDDGLFAVSAGDLEVTINVPEMHLMKPEGGSVSHTTSYPNYNPTYNFQIHGGSSLPKYAYAYLYLECVDTDTSNSVLGRRLIAAVNSRSDYTAGNYYEGDGVGTDGGGFGGLDSPGISSVTGDTEITLASGRKMRADQIFSGEPLKAWSWNDKIDGVDEINKFDSFKLEKVKKRKVDKVYKVVVGDKEVRVSDTHGFWLDNNEEVSAVDIIPNETKVYIVDGDDIKLQTVDSVEEIETDEWVYTFEVPGVHNYISNDILSHNPATWIYTSATTVSGYVGSQSAQSNQTKTINISRAATNAAFRYSIRLAAASGRAINIDSSGNTSSSYKTHTVRYDALRAAGQIPAGYLGRAGGYQPDLLLDTNVSFAVASNFVEIKAGGIQVVSDPDTFVKIPRQATGGGTILEAKGGESIFEATGTGIGETAMTVKGNLMPENGDDFDFGSASDMWKNIYGHNLNGVDIENLAVSLDDGPGATTTDTNSVNDNYDSYVKLPGGVILQWGHIYDTSSPRYVAFPTQFPNVIHSVVCSTNRNSGGSNGYNHVYNYDRNGVELILDGNYGFWIAIGH
jgi:hypothetical protein